MSELQLRLQEAQSIAEIAAADLSPDEQTITTLRVLEARKAAIQEDIDAIKAELRARCALGEIVGSDTVGHYQLQSVSPRVTFDYKAAMMDGLFTRKAAAPYLKTSDSTSSLVFKSPKENKKC